MTQHPRELARPTIREIRHADIGRCFDIRTRTRENAVSREGLKLAGITEGSVVALLATTHRGWVGERGGDVVGFSIGDGSNGELWVVAVLPEHEGRGIGTQLVGSAQRWLHALGWAEIWLSTSPDVSTRAYALYRRLGWRDCGVRDGQLIMRHAEVSDARGGITADAADRHSIKRFGRMKGGGGRGGRRSALRYASPWQS